MDVIVDGQQPVGYVWDGSCYTPDPWAQPFWMPFPVDTASTSIGIGKSGWSTGIKGIVDEVAIYPVALSASELTIHYRLGRTQQANLSFGTLPVAPLQPMAGMGNHPTSEGDVFNIDSQVLDDPAHKITEKGRKSCCSSNADNRV